MSAALPLVLRNMMSCSGLLMPSRDSSSVVMIWSGRALLFGFCRMRDPVTMIASPTFSRLVALASETGVSAPVGVFASSVFSLSGRVVVWAAAGAARPSVRAAKAVPETRQVFRARESSISSPPRYFLHRSPGTLRDW
ncbi:MAG TPA: hypothetical protein VGB65_06390 [Allosphingosinicella sp.]